MKKYMVEVSPEQILQREFSLWVLDHSKVTKENRESKGMRSKQDLCIFPPVEELDQNLETRFGI